MEDVVGMSKVSRRWRFLWRSIQNVDFTYDWVVKTGKEVIPSVTLFIRRHRGKKIRRFHVALRYTKSKLHFVKAWISFALAKNVEELEINLSDMGDQRKSHKWVHQYFQFPKHFYESSSLVKLSLTFLTLALPDRMHLNNLRELVLNRVDFSDDVIYRIATHCPMLEFLSLTNCNMKANLVVRAPQRGTPLKVLITDGFFMVDYKSDLVIDVPTLAALDLGSGMTRKRFLIGNVPVGIEARLNFDEMLCAKKVVFVTGVGLLGAARYDKNLRCLLETFQSAKCLHLCSWCIQVLSVKQMMTQEVLLLHATELVLDTGLVKWELPGIAFLLRACPYSENLAIILVEPRQFNINNTFTRNNDFEEEHYWASTQKKAFGCLQTLRVVQFKNVFGVYQTWDEGMFDMQSFFTGYKNGIRLLAFLLNNAKNLERVVFRTTTKSIIVLKNLLSTGE